MLIQIQYRYFSFSKQEKSDVPWWEGITAKACGLTWTTYPGFCMCTPRFDFHSSVESSQCSSPRGGGGGKGGGERGGGERGGGRGGGGSLSRTVIGNRASLSNTN